MSNRRPSPRNRALRPSSEGLETRQLLSSQVTGTDLDGDTWALTLFGPGTMNVSTAAGSPINPSVPSEIDSITLAGTDNRFSKLVGTVTRAPGGDGQVFFQNLREIGGGAQPKLDLGNLANEETINNGLLAIDMPDFWL